MSKLTSFIFLSLALSMCSADYCEDFIHQLPNYSCIESESLSTSGTRFLFKVSRSEPTSMISDNSVIQSGKEYLMSVNGMDSIEDILTVPFLERNINGMAKLVELTNGYRNGTIYIFESEHSSLRSLESFFSQMYSPFSEEKVLLRFVAGFLNILESLHSQLFVLRDFNIGNIMVTEDNMPYLFNFTGIVSMTENATPLESNFASSQKEVYNISQGTKMKYNGGSDEFGLGVVMYFMLFNAYPFETPQTDSYHMGKVRIPFMGQLGQKSVTLCKDLLIFEGGNEDVEYLRNTLYEMLDSNDFPLTTNQFTVNIYGVVNIIESDESIQVLSYDESLHQKNEHMMNRMYNEQDSSPANYSPIKKNNNLVKEDSTGKTYQIPIKWKIEMDSQNNEVMKPVFSLPSEIFQNQSYVGNNEGPEAKTVLIFILIGCTYLFCIAAIVFMVMACRKDYDAFFGCHFEGADNMQTFEAGKGQYNNNYTPQQETNYVQ